MIKKLSHKIKSDEGASVTIMGMAIVLLTIFVGMFMLDLGKNSYLVSIQTRNTQMAAQTAIKEQTGTGGLKLSAVNEAIDEYMKLRTGTDGTKDYSAFLSRCQTRGNYPKITIRMSKNRSNNDSGVVYVGSTYNGNKITFAPNAVANWNAVQSKGELRDKVKVLEIEVEDSVDNFMLGLIGQPCSTLRTKASAITSTTFDDETK